MRYCASCKTYDHRGIGGNPVCAVCYFTTNESGYRTKPKWQKKGSKAKPQNQEESEC